MLRLHNTFKHELLAQVSHSQPLGTRVGNTKKKYNRILDSATLQSTQWIINAAYNQRSLQSAPLSTA
jgi:hypothetical protein